MYLKFKKLTEEAVIPDYAKTGDAGLDLRATSLDKSKNIYWEYGTGLAVQIPKGFVGLLFPRSSISNTQHQLRNSVGVIDSGYRGEIKVRMSPDKGDSQYVIGDKIAQLIIMEVPRLKVIKSNHLDSSERGIGGFGSSGR